MIVKAELSTQTIKCAFYYVCGFSSLVEIDLASSFLFVKYWWTCAGEHRCLFDGVVVVADRVGVVNVKGAGVSLGKMYENHAAMKISILFSEED